MTAVTLPDAQKRLPELLNAARQGVAVEITGDGWTYRLTAVFPAARRPRPPVTGVPRGGDLEGLLVVPDNFDEPLEELREYVE